MDKIKPILAQLKKRLFWVLTSIIVIAGLVGWFMATGSLASATKASESMIDSKFSEVNGVGSDVPNPQWAEEYDVLTKDANKDVSATWNKVYQMQRDFVLKWPEDLGPDFIKMVRSLGPEEDIVRPMRDRYYTYIRNQFPRLLAIIDAENRVDVDRFASSGASGGEKYGSGAGAGDKYGPGAGRPGGGRFADGAGRPPGGPGVTGGAPPVPTHDYKVIWDDQSQAKIVQLLTWRTTPDTRQVRRAQEDLWVCEALLQIIKKVNASATGHHNAKIRRIEELSFAQPAANEFFGGSASGRIKRRVVDATRSGYTPGANAPAPASSSVFSGPGGDKAPDPEFDDRYVDQNGKPTTVDPHAEFKRMPVFLRLEMDQREISRLLAECADSPLPVEVRQFRINCDRISGNAAARSARKGSGGESGEAPRIIKKERDPNDESFSPYDVTIELCGIIYIFNPPDKEHQLAPSGETPKEEAKEAAAPAATP